MIRSFTGPTELTRRQRLWVARRALQLGDKNQPELWRSGCAYGVDTIVAYLAVAVENDLELYVPNYVAHNDAMVLELGESADVILANEGLTISEAYRNRNTILVRGSDILTAFVREVKFYRSGEWMTINIAKKLGVQVQMERIPPSC